MKIPMPRNLLIPAIAFFSLLSLYYLFQTVDAITSGSITADKRYHQSEVFLSEDPQTFYINLAFMVIGFAAPAWVAFVLFRKRRSKPE